MNSPARTEILALRYSMEYLMHNPNKPIMYSRKNISPKNEIPLQCFFKAGNRDINQTQDY